MNQRHNQQFPQNKSRKKMTSRQFVAWVGILLLAGLYVVTLLVAIFDKSSSGKLFALCLFATVAIPLLIWIYSWLYSKVKNREDQTDIRP